MLIQGEVSYWTLIDLPEKLDFLRQERGYNLDKKLQTKAEGILKDYKLYKNGSTWILQNDSQSKKKIDNFWYDNIANVGLGKIISFDAGKNWIYFDKYDFPELLEFENKNLASENFIKDGNYRYFLENVKQQDGSETSEVESFYEIVKKENGGEMKDEESRVSRYFILDAGLIKSDKEKRKNCRNEEMPINTLFWLEIESVDGKNRQRVYYDMNPSVGDVSGISCIKTIRPSQVFRGESLNLLKEKTGLEITN